jgi:hypothetical protein
MKRYKRCRYNGKERTELCEAKGTVPRYNRIPEEVVGEDVPFQTTESLVASINVKNAGWLVLEAGVTP